MKKIRILHITQSVGGVLRYIQMLLKYMDKEKFENIILCSFEAKPEDYKEFVIAFEQIEMKREISFSDLKAIKFVRQVIKKYNPDIVYAHSSKGGAVARLADIGLKNKCVYNPHGWAFNMHCSRQRRKLYIMIERLAARFCDKIICISEFEKQSAVEKKICKKDKLQVILNGIDIEGYEKAPHNQITRTSLMIPENAFVVGMVGRICPQKAPDVFIKAAKKIKEVVPNSFFIIVGDGKKEDIINYARQNGFIDSLLITGWVENPMSYIELFDAAVLLSRWEGFGLVLPEYMLAQKPVVATSVDAIPSIIKNTVNGLLVEPENITQAYEALLKLHQDSLLAEKLVRAGIKDVHTRFDIKRVVKEHENLFKKLIEKK